MRVRLGILAALLSMGFMITADAIAATDSVQAQISDLQKEVKNLKHQLNAQARNSASKRSQDDDESINKVAKIRSLPPAPTQTGNAQTATASSSLVTPNQLFLPMDLDVPGQSYVSTGPYVGVPFQFSGTDLIINSPSVNTDLQLLHIRKNINEQVNALIGSTVEIPHHSHLLLSGLVEAQLSYVSENDAPNGSDLDLSNTSVDFFFMGPSNWTLGFIELSTDTSLTTGNFFRVNNSRVYVNKAFVTVGDLLITPFYATFGQFYVPFGTYSSILLDDPLTKLIARTKARAVLAGFEQQDKNAFYGSVYAFRGDSRIVTVSRINNGGINLGYKYDLGCFKGKLGGGFIGNIADSTGMQLGNGFAFFERIDHRVPAYNVRASLSIGENIDLLGEFIGATTKFDINDMMYNNHGAKPKAFDLEASYSFKTFCDKPSALGIVYTKSYEALSLGIPLVRKAIVFNTSLFRNTLQGIELERNTYYAAHDTANGPLGASPLRGSCTALECNGLGKSDTTIIGQFDYYF